MKFKKTTFAAVIVSGSLGLAANSIGGQDHIYGRHEMPANRYPTTSGDDQSLPPGVPGVTEQNTSDMSTEEVKLVQQALKTEGYDPGRSDGAMTNDTRAAIREFQKDNGIVHGQSRSQNCPASRHRRHPIVRLSTFTPSHVN